jgi:hypothetical protein
MNKEFIPYDQALALKELGFDKSCLLFIQYSSGTDVFTKEKYKNSIWLGNGYDAEIDDKKIKYKFPKHSEQSYGTLGIPLYQQAFRWFREKYDLHAYVDSMRLTTGETVYSYVIEITDGEESDDGKNWRTYEEAEIACLKKLIELVKNK